MRSIMLKEKPNAKIAVLYQNDDCGKDYLKGIQEGLGDKAAWMIVAEATYEVTDPTVDFADRHAEVARCRMFFNIARRSSRRRPSARWPRSAGSRCTSSTASRLHRRRHEAGGTRKCRGRDFGAYLKDPTDPQWKDDAGMKDLDDS